MLLVDRWGFAEVLWTPSHPLHLPQSSLADIAKHLNIIHLSQGDLVLLG